MNGYWDAGRAHLAAAARRLRQALWPITQTAVAAGTAWWLTHDVLGHPEPFFAPIAAAISMGATNLLRSLRALQMMLGVCLGIGIGQLIATLAGTGAVTVGLVVALAISAAVLLGAGFIGQGPMFTNQTAAAAILVVTLQRSGTASERLTDAVVGGGVALVVSLVLFPASPLPLLRGAVRDVLHVLADALTELLRCLERNVPADLERMLAVGHRIHAQLAVLSEARRTARMIVRIAPPRWGMRVTIRAEDRRAAGLDLLATTVLDLLRLGSAMIGEGEPVTGELRDALGALAGACGRVADGDDPGAAVERVRRAAALAAKVAGVSLGSACMAWLVRHAHRDLLHVAGEAAHDAASDLPD